MNEYFEDSSQDIKTGNGNKFLSNICSALFGKTGNIGYHNLGERLIEPAEQFDYNFSSEEEDLSL